jgi:hypothetical protein
VLRELSPVRLQLCIQLFSKYKLVRLYRLGGVSRMI